MRMYADTSAGTSPAEEDAAEDIGLRSNADASRRRYAGTPGLTDAVHGRGAASRRRETEERRWHAA